MYISFLDYLNELKSKYYIVILFILTFLAISYAFNFYKTKYATITAKASLVKLSAIQLNSREVEFNVSSILEWISEAAVNDFQNDKENVQVKMNCSQENNMLTCIIKTELQSKEQENKIKDSMLNSINSAFDQYANYSIEIMEDLIVISSDIKDFVENSDIATVKEKAFQRQKLQQIELSKSVFSKGIKGSKIVKEDISIQKYKINMNYSLILISALICGFFVVFLQMKDRK